MEGQAPYDAALALPPAIRGPQEHRLVGGADTTIRACSGDLYLPLNQLLGADTAQFTAAIMREPAARPAFENDVHTRSRRGLRRAKN